MACAFETQLLPSLFVPWPNPSSISALYETEGAFLFLFLYYDESIIMLCVLLFEEIAPSRQNYLHRCFVFHKTLYTD